MSRNNTQSAIGTSTGELERRAELRRHRHKRIQEELSNSHDEAVPSLDPLEVGPAITFNAAAFVHMTLMAPEMKGYTLEEMDEVFDSGLEYLVIDNETVQRRQSTLLSCRQSQVPQLFRLALQSHRHTGKPYCV
ncbi:hypothetical protein QBC37DRAFT_400747 [Rhypophila decipiens]|uniref:Uncharacterized protein n=1 Tax=Rhypophila decipiens TaxID=261697 RepID=A0AAN7B720_9PEZI|nr:hypothetical protein QBC37DRAFT_400747 [Rhypophila decipiens]